ncbi:Hsp20/alpha crystallin family protein [Rhodoferax antarcticus]|uniref:Hsp20/alpha crystallin family protein n=1 Tax=Rhodoferax antarcticus TaxID=81479 RepID=UPI002224C763|nr:Hsp20/alpha crystallin family protein [Rhodoferax antarcticus]MCW2313324.1 HSP20 family protein [Rhodoferax antarcticus]
MANEDKSEQFLEGKQRLEEIGRRLGGLFAKPAGPKAEESGLPGFLGGLGGLIDQLGKLADEAHKAGGVASKSGEFDVGSDKRMRGVYGFSVKTGLGGDRSVKVEPFGNIRKDERSGRVEVQEIREPMTDLFDEPTHILIVAEVPGITQEDVRLEIHDDILTLAAERGEKKYHKEMLLPTSFSADQMSFTCRGGIVEIRLNK